MRLEYWYAQCLDGSELYSIREKTKKAAKAEKEGRGADRFGPVKKVKLEYENAFDLMIQCMSEGWGWWES